MKSFIGSLVVRKVCWETGPLSNSLLNGAFIFATLTRKIYLERKVFFIIHFGFKPYFWELKMELKNGFDRVEFTSIFLLRQKNPRILKFIENSVFNSFVNSCLIIKSYKLSSPLFQHQCISRKFNQRAHCINFFMKYQFQNFTNFDFLHVFFFLQLAWIFNDYICVQMHFYQCMIIQSRIHIRSMWLQYSKHPNQAYKRSVV